jgi:ABC-type Na+ efflux pump permease subunit
VSTDSFAFRPTRSQQFRRLVAAELLKLRRRRSLVAASLVLIVAPMVVSFVVLVVLHAVNPGKYGPAGGVDNLRGALQLLSQIGVVAAVLIGVNAGGGDLAAGLFANSLSPAARGSRSSPPGSPADSASSCRSSPSHSRSPQPRR